MIIYNVTTRLEWSIADDWVKWMQEKHIPEVMATEKFMKYQFVKLLGVDDVEGPTYAIQYFAATKDDYDVYIEQYAPNLRKAGIDKWGDNFISFRSLMQEVE